LVIEVLSAESIKLPVIVGFAKKANIFEVSHTPHNRLTAGDVLECATMPADEFVGGWLMVIDDS
jgi:hypothetical protein